MTGTAAAIRRTAQWEAAIGFEVLGVPFRRPLDDKARSPKSKSPMALGDRQKPMGRRLFGRPALASVPPAVPGEAGRGAQDWSPHVLRQPRSADRRPSPRIWSHYARSNGWSTASAHSAGPRRCWPICRATPPRRHLQQPIDRARRQGRHLQVEGLPDRRPRSVQGDDARDPRVHPPVPHPRAAQRLPPHPSLRPSSGVSGTLPQRGEP